MRHKRVGSVRKEGGQAIVSSSDGQTDGRYGARILLQSVLLGKTFCLLDHTRTLISLWPPSSLHVTVVIPFPLISKVPIYMHWLRVAMAAKRSLAGPVRS